MAECPTAPHQMLRSSRFALCEGQSLERIYECVAEWTGFSLDVGFMPKSRSLLGFLCLYTAFVHT